MSKFGRLTAVLIALVCLVFVTSVFAYNAPDPVRTFYGDATGDMSVAGDDLSAHRTVASGGSATYATTQPQTGGQYWNTCDLSGDGSCAGDDIPSLIGVASGGTTSYSLSGWAISNYDLNESGNTATISYPFRLNVATATMGRPGVIIKVTIESDSTTTGSLVGRTCTPGSDPDELNTADDQCAVAVTVTDFYGDSSVGPTESGTTGLQIQADGAGTIHLLAEVIVQTGLLLPAMTLDLYPEFVPPGGNSAPVNNAPTSASGNETPNSIGFSTSPTDAEQGAASLTSSVVSATGACTGGSMTAAGRWTFTFPESVGPTSCNVVSRVFDGYLYSSNVTTHVIAAEVNTIPVDTAPSSVSGNESPSTIGFTVTMTDSDIPTQTLTCSFVSATGACTNGSLNTTTCRWSWTPSEAAAPTSCDVVTRAYDTVAYSANKTTRVISREVNTAPVNGAPSSVSGNESPSSIGFTATRSDTDIPTQTLTCSLVSSTGACTGGSFNTTTCRWSFTFPESVAPTSCNVVTRVNDTVVNTDKTTRVIAREVNTIPVDTAPSSVSGNESPSTIGFTVTMTDADLPTQTLTCSFVSATGACTNGSLNTTTCRWSWTPSEAAAPTSCDVVTRAYDTVAYSANKTTRVIAREVNTVPVDTAPSSVSGNESPSTIGFTVTMTDVDVPTQTLTCSLVSATGACTNGSLNTTTCRWSWTPSEAAAPTSCDVVTRAYDTVAYSANKTTRVIAREVNTAPVNGAPSSVSGNESPSTIGFTATRSDTDIPTQTLTCSLVSSTGACTNGSFNTTTCRWNWTFTEAQGPTSCDVVTRVNDTVVNTDKTTRVIAREVNTAPVDNAPSSVSGYESPASIAFVTAPTDSDVPTQTLTSSVVSSTGACTGGAFTGNRWVITVPASQGPTSCDVVSRVYDTVAYSTNKTTRVIVRDTVVGVTWSSTGPSATVVGGLETPLVARVANNYPPDWAKVTVRFSGTITACGGSVVCGTTNQAGSWAVASPACTFTATAGYFTSNATCTVKRMTSTPACTNCTGKEVAFKTALRTTECSPLGGTCGGFIDTASTYNTGTTVTVSIVRKENFALITSASPYYSYLLFEQNFNLSASSVERTEQFDSNGDGTFTVTATSSTPAKVTTSYKGAQEGSCYKVGAYDVAYVPDTTRDCFMTGTYIDVDARKIIVPLDYTGTEDIRLPKYYLRGEIGIATFRSMVRADPPGPSGDFNGLPNPLRIGFASTTYRNQSLADLNMSTIFQPEAAGRTLTICYGDGGNYDISIGASLPYNVIIPDLVRQDWTAGCSGGQASAGFTGWRYYTNVQNVTVTVMLLGGLCNISLYNLDKGLNMATFPIFLKAFGDVNATITTYTDGTLSATLTNAFEIDYRDPSFTNNGLTDGGANGNGRSVLATLPRALISDPRRVAMGTNPTEGGGTAHPERPYGDPNRWEQANWSTGGQFTKSSPLIALGGRVPGATASDPGFVVVEQLHMTTRVDDSRFTYFQRAIAVVGDARPDYVDRAPYSGSSTNTGVVSEWLTGIPSTYTTTQVNWSQVQDAVSANLQNPSTESQIQGGLATSTNMPGSTMKNTIIMDLVDGAVKPTTEWLNMVTIASPTSNKYYIPAQLGYKVWTGDTTIPINRDGQIWRGTAGYRGTGATSDDRIQKKTGGWYYFTLNCPAINYDATRRADYMVVYLADGRAGLDARRDAKDPAEGYWNRKTPYNRFWKFFGKVGGKSGAATYEFTIPYILVGSRAIGGTTSYVPRPFMGGGYRFTSPGWTLEWDYFNQIIGTKASEGAVVSAFDYQSQSFNWFNIGMTYHAGDRNQFIWSW